MQISIPGSSSGIDTEKLINDLIEAEKAPSIRVEEDIKKYESQYNLWKSLDRNMSLAIDSAKKLYSFESPFKERRVESSEPSILQAEASREAPFGEYEVIVKRIASSDRWVSQKIDKEYRPPKGVYRFYVGKKEIDFNFQGTTLNALMDQINKVGKNNLKVSTIQRGSSAKELVILLEGLDIGAEGKLQLAQQAKEWAKQIGLLGLKDALHSYYSLSTKDITDYYSNDSFFQNSSIGATPSSNTFMNNFLTLNPGAIAKITLDKARAQSSENFSKLLSKQNASINFELYYTPKKADELEELPPVSITLNETRIYNEKTQEIKEFEKAHKGTVEDPNFALLFDENDRPIVTVSQSSLNNNEAITFSIPLSKLMDAQNNLSFLITNPLPQYSLIVNSVLLSDNSSTDMLAPVQAISEAEDAVVNYNGIDLYRDTNSIDSIIPGLTLNLKRADDTKTVLISINNDSEVIKDSIIALVGSYNQLMRDLTITTNTNPNILDNLQFPTDEDREKASEYLGAFYGEFGLTSLINSLQNAAIVQYNNSVDREVSTLRTIGIGPNIAGGGTFDINNNRFLDIDEQTLDNAIASKSDAIAALMGSDTNNDVIIDYGFAFKITELLTRYTQSNGIINQKETRLQSQITNSKRTLDRYQDRLTSYESELRRKFGNMEQTVEELSKTGNIINNFMQPNNNSKN